VEFTPTGFELAIGTLTATDNASNSPQSATLLAIGL
jgi:hypothetical protein